MQDSCKSSSPSRSAVTNILQTSHDITRRSAATIASNRLAHLTRTFQRTMASTSRPQAPAEAPWKATFKSHLSKMETPEFVFTSLHPAPSSSPVPYVPRARYCIHRAFWAELPENKHNTAPMNDRVYESDMPSFTTDVRMQKVFELFNSSSGKADRGALVKGSGGGGPVEAVWWVKDVMVQWRVKGEAFIVGPDIEDESESSGVRTVKSELGKRMRVVNEEGKDAWSWKREVTGHFGNISPGMRGMLLYLLEHVGYRCADVYSQELSPPLPQVNLWASLTMIRT